MHRRRNTLHRRTKSTRYIGAVGLNIQQHQILPPAAEDEIKPPPTRSGNNIQYAVTAAPTTSYATSLKSGPPDRVSLKNGPPDPATTSTKASRPGLHNRQRSVHRRTQSTLFQDIGDTVALASILAQQPSNPPAEPEATLANHNTRTNQTVGLMSMAEDIQRMKTQMQMTKINTQMRYVDMLPGREVATPASSTTFKWQRSHGKWDPQPNVQKLSDRPSSVRRQITGYKPTSDKLAPIRSIFTPESPRYTTNTTNERKNVLPGPIVSVSYTQTYPAMF